MEEIEKILFICIIGAQLIILIIKLIELVIEIGRKP